MRTEQRHARRHLPLSLTLALLPKLFHRTQHLKWYIYAVTLKPTGVRTARRLHNRYSSNNGTLLQDMQPRLCIRNPETHYLKPVV